MPDSERVEHAAQLLERLLADAEFRARFRARPAQICREVGFTDIAEEIATTPGALQTLEQRESRSSLLGVLMVAAMEGAGALEIAHLVGGGLTGDARAAAHAALARSGVAAIGSGGPKLAPVSYAADVPGVPGLEAPGAGAAGAAGAADASGAPAAGAPAAPAAPPDAAGAAAAPGTPGAPAVATPGATSAPPGAATGAPAAGGPPPDVAPAGGQAWPDVAPPAGSVDASGWPVADAPPGAAGGGAGAAALQALTQNPNIAVAPAAQAALASADARFAPLLTALARDHRLGIGAAPGGALRIMAVDGTPVSTGNTAARVLMSEIAKLDPSLRPSQVAGPWRIAEPGFVGGPEHESAITLAYAGAPPGSPAVAEPAAPGGLAQAADAAAPGHGGGFDVAAAARDYPGDKATPAQIARWMGDWAQRAGLPRELPVMAALVESGLHNVDHGDSDSLGFFQMRTSGWMEQYPDFPHHPELQLKWFIDTATAKKGSHSSTDASGFGEWIADTEQPRGDLRGKYQPQLDQARELLGSAGGPADPPGAGMAYAAAAADPAAATGPAGATDPTATGPAGAAAPAGASASASAGAGAAGSQYATISFQAPAAGTAAPGAGAAVDDAAAAAARTAAGILPGAQLTAAGTTPDAVRRIFERAAALDAQHLPYVLGGGHSAGIHDVSTVGPVDCSGAVSAVLGVDARVSGAFEAWGEAGPGKYVTVYANEAHVLMEINGHFFGTSASNPGGGAGWIPRGKLSEAYLARFTARHPPGM